MLTKQLLITSFTLVTVLVMQTLIMGIGMWLYDKVDLINVFTYWKPASMTGLFGALTSIG